MRRTLGDPKRYEYTSSEFKLTTTDWPQISAYFRLSRSTRNKKESIRAFTTNEIYIMQEEREEKTHHSL